MADIDNLPTNVKVLAQRLKVLAEPKRLLIFHMIKVMETGILPKINAGIVHKNPGIGGIGAGITQAPGKCFRDAFYALRELCY